MFDLRHLEHSTIIYEDPQHHPLLRLAWNKQDPNYLATMAMDAMEVRCPSEHYNLNIHLITSAATFIYMQILHIFISCRRPLIFVEKYFRCMQLLMIVFCVEICVET